MKKVIFSILLGAFCISNYSEKVEAAVVDNNGSTIYAPGESSGNMDAGATYPKLIELKNNGESNGRLIATFDQGKMIDGRQVWPIYESDNKGETWNKLTDFTNSFSEYPFQMNPFLYEVEVDSEYSKKGDLLLTGIVKPVDNSKTVLVIYKSSDCGKTWSLYSTVDEGGPADYDPSPESKTTPIWEPVIYLNGQGNLSIYYSDERQKDNGVLQALVMRSSADGGKTWGRLHNVVAIPNKADRPGMFTMTQLPDKSFIAAYEVVNRPSFTKNFAQVFVKKSVDGVDWNADDLGSPVYDNSHRTPGSSPSIAWIDDGSENGKIVIASKWSINSEVNLEQNQNLFVSENLGEAWTKEPLPVSFSSLDDTAHNTAYSQSIILSADHANFYQVVTVENDTTRLNDVKFGSLPTKYKKYEAEDAELGNVQFVNHYDASNAVKVGGINYSDSYINFNNINVQSDGEYEMLIRFDNGFTAEAIHSLSINGKLMDDVIYPKTKNWGRYQWKKVKIHLVRGENTIKLAYKVSFSEIDCIYISKN